MKIDNKINEKADTQQKYEKIGIAYVSGSDKLRSEENKMLESVKPEYREMMQVQLDLLFLRLIELAEQDIEFEKKVLFSHKSMERCLKYCSDKAMGIRQPSNKEKEAARNNNVPIVTPVGETMLLSWIMEYYDRDDEEDVEKEVAAQRKIEKKQKGNTKKKVSNTDIQAKKKKVEKVVDSRKKEMENQLSLFDWMEV